MSVRMEIVAVVGACAIRAFGHSWRYVRGDAPPEVRSPTGPVIYAFWHGRLLPLAFMHRGRSSRVLASAHRDGEMLARTLGRLGYGHVRGSSTRGGAGAIRGLVDAVRAGHDLGLTVDGPRGPRHVVKPGVVEVAKLTGRPVVTITSASRHHRTFASWDAFELPWPFARVRVDYGRVVWVPPDADAAIMEARRREIEAELLRITEESDHAARA